MEDVGKQAGIRMRDGVDDLQVVDDAVQISALVPVDGLEQHSSLRASDDLQHLSVEVDEVRLLLRIQLRERVEERQGVLRAVLELDLGDGADLGAHGRGLPVHRAAVGPQVGVIRHRLAVEVAHEQELHGPHARAFGQRDELPVHGVAPGLQRLENRDAVVAPLRK